MRGLMVALVLGLVAGAGCAGTGESKAGAGEPKAQATEAPSKVAAAPPQVAARDGDPEDLVREAAEATWRSGSLVSSGELLIQTGEETLSLAIEELVMFDGDVELKVGRTEPERLVFTEGRVFHTSQQIQSELGADMWFELDEEGIAEDMGVPPDLAGFPMMSLLTTGALTTTLVESARELRDLSVLGREVAGTTASTHYMGRTEGDSLGPGGVLLEVWVGDDNLLRQLKTVVSSDALAIELLLTLSNHGELGGVSVPTDNYIVEAGEHRTVEDALSEVEFVVVTFIHAWGEGTIESDVPDAWLVPGVVENARIEFPGDAQNLRPTEPPVCSSVEDGQWICWAPFVDPSGGAAEMMLEINVDHQIESVFVYEAPEGDY